MILHAEAFLMGEKEVLHRQNTGPCAPSPLVLIGHEDEKESESESERPTRSLTLIT